jgi:TolB-like protein
VRRPARSPPVRHPFTNLSSDPNQDYFADGITENLTTDLSRIRNSFVIARNTAFTFKGKSSDAKEVGRQLGVRYVLEGSVQREQNKVRVNAQLIDADSNDGEGGILALMALLRIPFWSLLRNSSDASDYFRLPRDMVVEIGRQFAI